MVPFENFGTVSYSDSRVTMALSCIIFKIKQGIGRKSLFSHTPLHSTPLLGGIQPTRRCIAVPFGVEKLEWCGHSAVKKFDDMFSRFDRIPACDRRTDGKTDGQTS